MQERFVLWLKITGTHDERFLAKVKKVKQRALRQQKSIMELSESQRYSLKGGSERATEEIGKSLITDGERLNENKAIGPQETVTGQV